MKNIQPIEYADLIPLAKEEESSNNESEDDCTQIFFIKRKKEDSQEDWDNPFINDINNNKEEPIAKEDNQDTLEFTEADEFSR